MNSHFYGMTFTVALLGATTTVACGGQPAQSDDDVYDMVVRDFIRFDIGQIRDPLAVEQIKYRFSRLRTDDAVPALVRGLNASTRMRASCPITALSSKLRGIVGASRNPQVGTFLLQNLDRANAGPYSGHVNMLLNIAEAQVARTSGNALAEQRFRHRAEEDSQRLVHTPGMKLTDLMPRETNESPIADASRESNRNQTRKAITSRSVAARANGHEAAASPTAAAPDWTKLSTEDLIERLGNRPSQSRALGELFRRASDGEEQAVAEVPDAAEAIVHCLNDGDDSAREAAARLLGLLRIQQSAEPLINALEDPNSNIRSAAATALTRITRQLYGPSDDATPEQRQAAVARWRDWLSRQRKNH